jgi:hypothetical protein
MEFGDSLLITYVPVGCIILALAVGNMKGLPRFSRDHMQNGPLETPTFLSVTDLESSPACRAPTQGAMRHT